MERKKITIELSVLTGRFRERDIEQDLDGLLMPLRKRENGDTTIDEYDIKRID